MSQLRREGHRYITDVLWGLLVGALLAALLVWGVDAAHAQGDPMPGLQIEMWLPSVTKGE